MSEEEQVAMMLHEIICPRTKEECIEQAVRRGASEDMVAMMQDLPVEAFDHVSDVRVIVKTNKGV